MQHRPNRRPAKKQYVYVEESSTQKNDSSSSSQSAEQPSQNQPEVQPKPSQEIEPTTTQSPAISYGAFSSTISKTSKPKNNSNPQRRKSPNVQQNTHTHRHEEHDSEFCQHETSSTSKKPKNKSRLNKKALQAHTDKLSVPSSSSHHPDHETQSIATSISSTDLSLRETLELKLSKQNYECMICYDKIKKHHATWSCQKQCFAVFHLFCIKKWAKHGEKSTTVSDDLATNTSSSSAQEHKIWRCPACQIEYDSIPNKYLCFCGKTKDPEVNPYGVPHSCGNVCGKPHGGNCPHECIHACHPGPCPDCELFRTETCFCGNLKYQVPCSGPIQSKKCCQQICGKVLSCGKHTCDKVCHPGDCEPCTRKTQQTCFCGKVQDLRPCSNVDDDWVDEKGRICSFSCHAPCGKKLSCGNHTCKKNCHTGECAPCERDVKLVKTCYCGKTPLFVPRNSCLDPIPTCTKVCGKLLPCGVHACDKICHSGPCGHCTKLNVVVCRCGQSTAKIPCIVNYYAKWRENLQKENQWDDLSESDKQYAEKLYQEFKKKYPVNVPFTCNTPCKATKNCGKHKCKEICCPQNPLNKNRSYDVEGLHICHMKCSKKLNCGVHKCDFPCHGSSPCPKCTIVIRQPVSCPCGHTVLQPPVLCGTPLPPCYQPCSIPRPCGHAPNHHCHDPSTNCPPCMEQVDKMCAGGHKIVPKVACCLKTPFCEMLCDKVLPCKIHKCPRMCHDGDCVTVEIKENEEFTSCGRICQLPLPCGHLCSKKCHTGPCDAYACHEKVAVFCPCGNLKSNWECRNIRQKVEDLGITEFELVSIPPLLECNKECKDLAWKKQLADAFQINVEQNEMPCFPEKAQLFAMKNLQFVKNMEKLFHHVMKAIVGTKDAYLLLPPMSGEKRETVHLMSQVYGFDSDSLDYGKNRSVQIRKTYKSVMPAFLLSDIVQDARKLKIMREKIIEKAKIEAEFYKKQMIKKYNELNGIPNSDDETDVDKEAEVNNTEEVEGTNQEEEKPENVILQDSVVDNTAAQVSAEVKETITTVPQNEEEQPLLEAVKESEEMQPVEDKSSEQIAAPEVVVKPKAYSVEEKMKEKQRLLEAQKMERKITENVIVFADEHNVEETVAQQQEYNRIQQQKKATATTKQNMWDLLDNNEEA